ncbi:probable chitinase 10 [Drosophila sulfurigaster albostrigata]|uniref:probable chitinase 10 n=1 Tax=Drosophila sulfurigaster albostrigata TaxID=89887 RepID=UPI002D21E53C|nr:probable chitinase 10 [Drosophila sulfurigaster albostrigata]
MAFQLFAVLCFVTLFGHGFAAVNICSNVTDNLFLPSVNSCSEYYLCISQTAISRNCSDDTYFDARDQQCVPVSEVRCLPKCPAQGLSTFCYDRTCTKYVMCFGGTPVIRECSDGLQYNAQIDRCDFPQYVDCVDNLCVRNNNANAIVYIASKARCNKYYVCLDGQPINQTCASGLQYNPEAQSCDFPSRVNCTVETLQRNIQPYSKVPPRSADIRCPEEGAHFFAHKTRKEAYYYCLNGRGVTLDCTPGLVYDAKLEECREPQFVVGA